ncbi:MAG: DoxX family protein [Bacteroidetes bacterium]|nr:DoxX family protein [Bacteroidota bacterium]
MKKILSTSYSETAFNIGVFVSRVTLGLMLCINHGFSKLTNFNEMQYTFFDPFHIGHRWSLILSIFAEVFSALLVVLGLFTRIAALIIVIDLAVAVFLFHKGAPVKQSEIAIVFLSGFFFLLLVGPGKFSVDGMMGK